MVAGSGRFAKKKSHIQASRHQFLNSLIMGIEFMSQILKNKIRIHSLSEVTFLQELERLQRKEERETRNRELSDEEDEDEIPVLVPIPEQVMGWEQNVGLLVVM